LYASFKIVRSLRRCARQLYARTLPHAATERHRGTDHITYSGELTGVPPSTAPNILDKSYTITAEVRERKKQ